MGRNTSGRSFTWTYTTPAGQPHSFQGTYTYSNGLLTLVPTEGPPNVARVASKGEDHGRFTFMLAGSGPGHPSLTFTRY